MRDAEILDTPPEADFAALTRIAAAICGTPIALVSLLDADRQWFKSRVGLAETDLETDLIEVPDAQADARFADNPQVVGRPHVRFYAGTPLRTAQGQVLGTLCVIDHVPRSLTPEQRSALRDLGQQATAQIEVRRTVAELRRAVAERESAETALRLLVVDLGLPEGEGRRLLDHLRTEERLSLMPLLVYSAQDVDERLLSKLALGPTRFLTKSRATDVEVRTVVSQMLGAEAREAKL